jgi:O-antigen biosynthesis protein WbqP
MYRYFKRLFDLFFATLFLILSSPLWLFAAIFIKISSEGPVLFISQRCGKNGILFDFLKFRTMNVGAPLLASHDIDAIQYLTRIGKFLRKTSLDEIPQLWNVIRGEMSLVGPRPVIPSETDLVLRRKALGVDTILPGITGWAQINGRDHVGVEEKAQLDSEYMHRQSLCFDFKIIILTIWKVLFAHDIQH